MSKYLKLNAGRDPKKGNHNMELMIKCADSSDIDLIRAASVGIMVTLRGCIVRLFQCLI